MVNKLKTLSKDAACRLYEQERLIVWTASAIAESLERTGLARTDLAEKLGKSRAYISQLLGGSRNMTLRTLADLAYACGQRVEFSLRPMAATDYLNFQVPMMTRPHSRVVEVLGPMDLDQRLLRLDDHGSRLAA